jgi:hypothetical protein
VKTGARLCYFVLRWGHLVGRVLSFLTACIAAVAIHAWPALADGGLEKTFDDIERLWTQDLAGTPREELIPAFRTTLSALDGALESGRLTPQGRAIVQYYRARLLFSLAEDNPSRELGEAAISASEEVLSVAPDFSDAAYIAGLSAYNILNDVPRAFGYWKRCAAQGHAGCMNVVADARLTGADGLPPNAAEAIAWHETVAATGTTWTCAGSYSALAVTEITFWSEGAASRALIDEWLGRARSLVVQLEAKHPGVKAPCEPEEIDLFEFLVRGATETSSLRRAEEAGADNVASRAARLIRGASKRETAFAARADGTPLPERDVCRIKYFEAAYLMVKGDRSSADPIANELLASDKCKPLGAMLKLRAR